MSIATNPTSKFHNGADLEIKFKANPNTTTGNSEILAHVYYGKNEAIFRVNCSIPTSSIGKNQKGPIQFEESQEISQYLGKIKNLLVNSWSDLKEQGQKVSAAAIHDRFIETHGKELGLV